MTKNPSSENFGVYEIAAELDAEMRKASSAGSHSKAQSSAGSTPKRTIDVRLIKKQLLERINSLWYPVAIKPEVSIIIPVHNKISFTFACLESLSRQKSRYSFEIVIVDNASSDATTQLISPIPGIKYISSAKNLGFVGGCNEGVKEARGEIIVFLNNDTIVHGNWLDAMVGRLLSDSSIGLVGSKLIYPDGSLQEAGSILFRDGSGYNVGKRQDPGEFQYNYIREVDYCSGASIAFRLSDFKKVGGLDKRYSPAYYEDADLAMSIRYKLGKKILYEPHSVVTHIEGGTSGIDINTGFKKYQPINQAKFLKKWKKELNKYHVHEDTMPEIAARYGKRKNILVVDSIVPEHNHDAGSLRMYHILISAVELGYNVTLYADNLVATQPYTSGLQSLGIEVVYGKEVNSMRFYESRKDMYDDVILSRPTTAIWHLEYLKAFQPKARLFYDTVDLHFLRISRQAEVEKEPNLKKEANKWQELEYYLMDNTSSTIIVSSEEQKLLNRLKPNVQTFTIPTINPRPELPEDNGHQGRQGLMFMGDYSRAPNYTAARWFVKEIFPLIKKKIPDIKLTLVGNHAGPIESLASKDVTVTGFVEDIKPFYLKSRVFICPLRYGAGVKGKISESIAFGLPVVSTAIGTEGMHLSDGNSCLEAEDPQKFAEQTIRLYEDQELWDKIQRGAIKVYDAYFSEEAGKLALKKALNA
jgi:GT2 family glycosyltransferase